MKHLFTYGTLMSEAILAQVAHTQPSSIAASLNGYRRYAIRGEAYPAIIPEIKGRVDGVVYLHIPPFAWNRLDEYEGKMYQRRTVSIILADGRRITAETYVLRPIYSKRLTAEGWDFNEFLQQHKARYIRSLS